MDRLLNATTPEDIFPTATSEAEITSVFRLYAAIVHPDKLQFLQAEGVSEQDATAAFQALNRWKDSAEKKFAAGTLGDRRVLTDPIVVKTRADEYTLTARVIDTLMSSTYLGTDKKGTPIYLKAMKSPADHDLLHAEIKFLKGIRVHPKVAEAKAKDEKSVNTLKLLPEYRTDFTNQSGTTQKPVVVYEAPPSKAYTMAEIMSAYPSGVPLEHAAWMFNRLMASLEWPHALGRVHAAIIPENVLVFPELHAIQLANWDLSVQEGGHLTKIATLGMSEDRKLYPQELLEKGALNTGADLYMAAKLFLKLTGGNIFSNELNPTWKTIYPDKDKSTSQWVTKIGGLIRSCLLSSTQRETSAAVVYTEFRQALEGIFGPPTFRDFKMP